MMTFSFSSKQSAPCGQKFKKSEEVGKFSSPKTCEKESFQLHFMCDFSASLTDILDIVLA